MVLCALIAAATFAGAVPGGAPVPDTLPMALVARDTITLRARTPVLDVAGLATDAFGQIYVTDAATHRLVRFDSTGRSVGESGSLGSAPGALRRPGSVVPFGTAHVAVLDRENRRVVSYDLFGGFTVIVADLGDAVAGTLGRVDPVALAADRGGAFAVADGDRDRVLLFDFSGRFVRALGGFGAGPGSFRGIAALAAAPHGELVTLERAGARVQRLDAGGRAVAAWALPGVSGRGPLAVAVDDSGRVAVGAPGALWLFAPEGGLLARRSDLAAPAALAFASDGALLVATGNPARVLRLVPGPAAQAVQGR
jgi:DNA-binding beta-propeller fold protein YncE